MRGLSQNARFRSTSPPEPEEHPPGEGLATALAAAIGKSGAETGEIENWRDCGWEFTVETPASALSVVVASAGEPGRWGVQIGPARAPGILRQVLGPRLHPDADATLALSRRVHAILLATGRFTDIRWRWDGDPSEAPPGKPRVLTGMRPSSEPPEE